MEFLDFSRDGQRLVTVARDGKTRLWDTRTGLLLSAPFLPGDVRLSDLPTAPLPVPAWLPELAEALACKRLNSTRVLEFVPDAGLWRLQKRRIESTSQDFYTRWAKWFFADPGVSGPARRFRPRRLRESSEGRFHCREKTSKYCVPFAHVSRGT